MEHTRIELEKLTGSEEYKRFNSRTNQRNTNIADIILSSEEESNEMPAKRPSKKRKFAEDGSQDDLMELHSAKRSRKPSPGKTMKKGDKATGRHHIVWY